MNGRSRPGQRGSALVLTVAATASLALVAVLLVAASLTAYEIVAFRADESQARLLAESALRRVERALAAGEIPAPEPLEPAWTVLWTPPRPPVPSGFRQLGFDRPEDAAPDRIRETEVVVELRLVLDPDGRPRVWERDPGDLRILVSATARATFRRAAWRLERRFAVPVEEASEV